LFLLYVSIDFFSDIDSLKLDTMVVKNMRKQIFETTSEMSLMQTITQTG